MPPAPEPTTSKSTSSFQRVFNLFLGEFFETHFVLLMKTDGPPEKLSTMAAQRTQRVMSIFH